MKTWEEEKKKEVPVTRKSVILYSFRLTAEASAEKRKGGRGQRTGKEVKIC